VLVSILFAASSLFSKSTCCIHIRNLDPSDPIVLSYATGFPDSTGLFGETGQYDPTGFF